MKGHLYNFSSTPPESLNGKIIGLKANYTYYITSSTLSSFKAFENISRSLKYLTFDSECRETEDESTTYSKQIRAERIE